MKRRRPVNGRWYTAPFVPPGQDSPLRKVVQPAGTCFRASPVVQTVRADTGARRGQAGVQARTRV